MTKLTLQEIFDIIVAECRNGCSHAEDAFGYLTHYKRGQVDQDELRKFLKVLNFAAIREEHPAPLVPVEKFPIGSKVTVLNKGATFDTYHNWPLIHNAPNFEHGDTPVEGEEFNVTYIGLHEHGEKLYVLDGKFIVGADAFEPQVPEGMPFFDY